jgi:hypothetical protein
LKVEIPREIYPDNEQLNNDDSGEQSNVCTIESV